ncbi:Kinesin-like protein KIF22, partial [Termitomyces sp. T112]
NKLTGNDHSRMAESAAINKSLSVLGQVVHALNSSASRIPYRNSKLTRILQDALGGSSIGLLICNLAPGTKFRQDTLNTLNFAVRTKNIENKPVINERDNRPAPKPHFAAVTIHPPPAKPAPAIIQAISTAGSSSGAGPLRSRQSLVPVSRVPRASMSGGYQSFVLPSARKGLPSFAEKILEEDSSDRSGSFGLGLTEKEIDERISRAVEAEVTRRLEERERQREKEEQDRRAREQELESQRPTSSTARAKPQSPRKEQTLPSGVLTPLLKRHKDLDDELNARLQELERKFERGNKEARLADVLSPVSKKKTGRAYVALARAHSEKGDLQVALDLYRKAESYVPDNIKLKERIIEIEWAVKNNREFVPTPKPPRKAKKQKKTKATPSEDVDMDTDEREPKSPSGQPREAMFGLELTNTGTDSPSK